MCRRASIGSSAWWPSWVLPAGRAPPRSRTSPEKSAGCRPTRPSSHSSGHASATSASEGSLSEWDGLFSNRVRPRVDCRIRRRRLDRAVENDILQLVRTPETGPRRDRSTALDDGSVRLRGSRQNAPRSNGLRGRRSHLEKSGDGRGRASSANSAGHHRGRGSGASEAARAEHPEKRHGCVARLAPPLRCCPGDDHHHRGLRARNEGGCVRARCTHHPHRRRSSDRSDARPRHRCQQASRRAPPVEPSAFATPTEEPGEVDRWTLVPLPDSLPLASARSSAG